MKFSKPPETFDQQIERLKGRGMIILDDTLARHYLEQLNYYRLAAYWLPFEQDHASHQFRDGTDFDQVLNLYVFDRELRLLIMDAIERIEVSLRSKLAYQLSHKYGTHPHLKPELFHDPETYKQALGRLKQEVKRSSEDFIRHLVDKYDEELPSIWAVVELMTLGQASTWYDNLEHRSDRKALADDYDMDEKYLRSFFHHLSTVRNLCAHHARLWNREFTFINKMPTTRPGKLQGCLNPESPRRLYNTLAILAYLLDVISPGHHWKPHLIDLIDAHQVNVKLMGFPENWHELPIWTGESI